ncbi:hypothetical protein [Anaerospora hongkongensis]|uniref:hypothetical protein n=1 Tax=Anaerospora hongkongensis TaxID=244830 RepID=UPI002FDAB89E
MNVEIMMDEFVKALETATSSLQLSDKKGNLRAPQVFDGYLPPPDPRDPNNEAFPYIIPRYMSDENTDEEATAIVKVTCGVYSDDDQHGWRDLLTLTNCIKTHFLSNPYFGDCFTVKRPLKREFLEAQPAPEWVGWFIFQISIPNIQEVNSDVEQILSGQK